MATTHFRRPRLPERIPDAAANTPGTGVETDLYALKLIQQRSAPALLVVGPDNRLLYVNEDAQHIFKDLGGTTLPVAVQRLCNRVRTSRGNDASPVSSGVNCDIYRGPGEALYSLRAFPVGSQENACSHVMVLVEKVVERQPVNSKRAREDYGLSDREIEVVELLAEGLCNKEIGAKLYVSEHTVKGHLKNITRKIGAESRGSIVAILK